MSSKLQIRRGTTAAIAAATGAAGELFFDIQKNTLVPQDGVTAGGYPLAKLSDVATAVATLLASIQAGTDTSAIAGGTVNAITATLATTLTSYTNGEPFTLISSGANTVAGVTAVITLGTAAQASVNIVKGGNQPLAIGDTGPAGYPMALIYSQTFGALVLLNPASTAVNSPQLQTITQSVAGNALTLGLNATSLTFRSATLSSGAVSTVTISSPLSLVVPSGATLGTVSGVSARLILLVAYNNGSPALCVVNLNGAPNLDETTLINTTAISATANTAGVIYSATAIANSPFRVVGFCDITETTAGTWATGPTTVQGIGGEALAGMSSAGYGQSWQNMTASRTYSVNYYNTTGKEITVSIYGNAASTGSGFTVAVNGLSIAGSSAYAGTTAFIYFTVPPGGMYNVGMGSLSSINWFERR